MKVRAKKLPFNTRQKNPPRIPQPHRCGNFAALLFPSHFLCARQQPSSFTDEGAFRPPLSPLLSESSSRPPPFAERENKAEKYLHGAQFEKGDFFGRVTQDAKLVGERKKKGGDGAHFRNNERRKKKKRGWDGCICLMAGSWLGRRPR